MRSLSRNVFRECCIVVGLLAIAQLPAHSASAQTAKLELIHGKPFVMVYLNGQGPFRFLVDTGTNTPIILTPELVERLKLQEKRHVHLNDLSGEGQDVVRQFRVPSIQVAGTVFTNVPAVEHDLGADDSVCEGMLGFGLFRDKLLTLDFPRLQMSISNGALRPHTGKLVLPMKVWKGLPIVSLKVNRSTMIAVLDSGSRGLSLPEPFVKNLHFRSEPRTYGKGQSLVTSFTIKFAQLKGNIHLGTIKFPNPYIEISDAFPIAVFGSEPMKELALTFDQRAGLVLLSPASSVHHLNPPPDPVWLVNAPHGLPPDPRLFPIN